jgi:hypothetical protein
MRSQIIDLCADYNKRHFKEFELGSENDAFVWLYDKLPTYGEMVHSVKPIKLESYLTEEQYEKLMS